jgi:hypothetical protein
MMQRSGRRILIGVGIGAFAGISLITGVLPFVITRLFGINSFEILLLVGGFTLPVALLWAGGGGLIGRQGGPVQGGLVLGLCGALSGLAVGVFALGGSMSLLLTGLLCGSIYGAIGGILIGYAFPSELEGREE